MHFVTHSLSPLLSSSPPTSTSTKTPPHAPRSLYRRTKSEVDRQSKDSEHTQELSREQMRAVATIEDMRLKFEQQLQVVRAELASTITTLQSTRATYEQQIMGE